METLKNKLIEEVNLESIKEREGFKLDKELGREFRARENRSETGKGETLRYVLSSQLFWVLVFQCESGVVEDKSEEGENREVLCG